MRTITFSLAFLAVLMVANAQFSGGWDNFMGGWGGRRSGPNGFSSPSYITPIASTIFQSKACRWGCCTARPGGGRTPHPIPGSEPARALDGSGLPCLVPWPCLCAPRALTHRCRPHTDPPPRRPIIYKLCKQPGGVKAIDNAIANAINGNALSNSRAMAENALRGDALALSKVGAGPRGHWATAAGKLGGRGFQVSR